MRTIRPNDLAMVYEWEQRQFCRLLLKNGSRAVAAVIVCAVLMSCREQDVDDEAQSSATGEERTEVNERSVALPSGADGQEPEQAEKSTQKTMVEGSGEIVGIKVVRGLRDLGLRPLHSDHGTRLAVALSSSRPIIEIDRFESRVLEFVDDTGKALLQEAEKSLRNQAPPTVAESGEAAVFEIATDMIPAPEATGLKLVVEAHCCRARYSMAIRSGSVMGIAV